MFSGIQAAVLLACRAHAPSNARAVHAQHIPGDRPLKELQSSSRSWQVFSVQASHRPHTDPASGQPTVDTPPWAGVSRSCRRACPAAGMP